MGRVSIGGGGEAGASCVGCSGGVVGQHGRHSKLSVHHSAARTASEVQICNPS